MNWKFLTLADEEELDYEAFMEFKAMDTDDGLRCLTYLGARSLDDVVACFPEDEEIWGIDEIQDITDGSKHLFDENMMGEGFCVGYVCGYRLKNGMPFIGIQCASPFIFFMNKETAEAFKQAVNQE